MSRRFDDPDAVMEFDASDDLRQLVFALQAPPCFGGRGDELEHHERGGPLVPSLVVLEFA